MAEELLGRPENSREEHKRIQIFPWLLWRLWKARNDLCFSNISVEAHQIVDRTARDAEEWISGNSEQSPQPAPVSQRNVKWIPPPPGTFKCNIDAAWDDHREHCGVGWFLRDDKGQVRWYGAKVYPKLLSCLEAEAAALVWAMNCVDNLGFKEVLFESDSKFLIQAVCKPKEWPRLTTYTTKILLTPRRFLQPSYCFMGRQANIFAGSIAKSVTSCPIYYAKLDCSIPHWLHPSVERENLTYV